MNHYLTPPQGSTTGSSSPAFLSSLAKFSALRKLFIAVLATATTGVLIRAGKYVEIIGWLPLLSYGDQSGRKRSAIRIDYALSVLLSVVFKPNCRVVSIERSCMASKCISLAWLRDVVVYRLRLPQTGEAERRGIGSLSDGSVEVYCLISKIEISPA
jgi:hypothetical protein